MPLDPERLARTFVSLCEIDSPSRQEGRIASYLKEQFKKEFGHRVHILEDQSALHTCSDTGNLVFRFTGDSDSEPFFFSCHLDTVEPGRGVKVVRHGDLFTSVGDTILGADDKAGIAFVWEMARVLAEDRLPHSSFELVLTTCEEIGLLGAKHLDFSMIHGKYGYALDSAGMDSVVVGAPASNRFVARVQGVAAHAGLHPEKGVNAITLAAQAIARFPHGRLDDLSTANVGVIRGGTATNIVPDWAEVEGEVRSHDPELLERYTDDIVAAFAAVASGYPPPVSASCKVEPQFPLMRVDEPSPVLKRLNRAARALGRTLSREIAGGGSDANIFNEHGLPTVILAIGMTDVHTTRESITLTDMVRVTELLLAIARA